MSYIHVFPKVAEQTGKAVKRELGTPAPQAPSETPLHPDEKMMYAWSIGVTSIARTLTDAPRYEDCPPEVFIG